MCRQCASRSRSVQIRLRIKPLDQGPMACGRARPEATPPSAPISTRRSAHDHAHFTLDHGVQVSRVLLLLLYPVLLMLLNACASLPPDPVRSASVSLANTD